MLTQNEEKKIALKFDSAKPRVDLLPTRALEETAKVLAFGAEKYGENNWRSGFAWSRLIGAALRHLFAFMRGEDCDEETGLSHLAHASCCVLFLLEHIILKYGSDDRYKEPKPVIEIVEAVRCDCPSKVFPMGGCGNDCSVAPPV